MEGFFALTMFNRIFVLLEVSFVLIELYFLIIQVTVEFLSY